MGQSKNRPGDWWAHFIAGVFLRILWAIIGAGSLLCFWRFYLLYEFGWSALILVLAAAALGAVFGPVIHKEEAERGRGSLSEIKRQSEQDSD